MDKTFKLKERGVVQQIIALAASVIVVGMIALIGVSIMLATYTPTQAKVTALSDGNWADPSMDVNIQYAANSSLKNTFDLLGTTTGYYQILFLAIIGGLAIAAILGYLAFSMMGKSNGGGSGAAL